MHLVCSKYCHIFSSGYYHVYLVSVMVGRLVKLNHCLKISRELWCRFINHLVCCLSFPVCLELLCLVPWHSLLFVCFFSSISLLLSGLCLRSQCKWLMWGNQPYSSCALIAPEISSTPLINCAAFLTSFNYSSFYFAAFSQYTLRLHLSFCNWCCHTGKPVQVFQRGLPLASVFRVVGPLWEGMGLCYGCSN